MKLLFTNIHIHSQIQIQVQIQFDSLSESVNRVLQYFYTAVNKQLLFSNYLMIITILTIIIIVIITIIII